MDTKNELSDFVFPDEEMKDTFDVFLGEESELTGGVPSELYSCLLHSFGNKEVLQENLTDLNDVIKYISSQEMQLQTFLTNMKKEQERIQKRISFVISKYQSTTQHTMKEVWLKYCCFYQSQFHSYTLLVTSIEFLLTQAATVVDPTIQKLAEFANSDLSTIL